MQSQCSPRHALFCMSDLNTLYIPSAGLCMSGRCQSFVSVNQQQGLSVGAACSKAIWTLREESHYRLSLTYLKNKFLPLSPWYRESNFLHISIIITRGVPSCPSCLFISLQYLVVLRMHVFSVIFLSCRFCFTCCILKAQSLLLFHAQNISELYHCKLQLPAPTAKPAPAYISSTELLVISQWRRCRPLA